MPYTGQAGDPQDLLNLDLSVATEIDCSGYTVLVKVPTSIIQNIGNNLLLTVQPPLAGGTLNNATVSYCATSGNAFEPDTTPTGFTIAGGSSLTMNAGDGPTDFDPLAFAQLVKPTIFGFNVGSATMLTAGYMPGVVSYLAPAVQEAATTGRVGVYVPYKDTIFLISALKVSP